MKKEDLFLKFLIGFAWLVKTAKNYFNLILKK